MARIAGVTTQKDSKGALTHITVNLKKHPGALPLLKNIGLVEKTKFELECEKGIPIEQARAESLAFLKTLPWKKYFFYLK